VKPDNRRRNGNRVNNTAVAYIRGIKEKIRHRFPGLFAFLVSYFRFVQFCYFCLKNKKFIYHVGRSGNLSGPLNDNIGDPILYNRLEKVLDICLGYENTWYRRHLSGEISLFEVYLINKYSRAIIVGGGGLFLADTNENNNSGWQFNIKIRSLQKISVPLVFMAIGYNVFRGQDDFIPVFKEHIKLCVEKAVFFGLRNYGSISAVKKYLPESLHPKLKFQPCPTTMTGLFSPKMLHIDIRNEIVVCLAFDRFQNRFGDDKVDEIFKQLIDFGRSMKEYEMKVLFAIHMPFEINTEPVKHLEENGFSIVPLFQYSEDEIYEFYRSKKLIIGMRGHSLMIPFGLSVPIISITNHNKQKWFIETTGYPEWDIEVKNYFYDDLIKQTLFILDNYIFVISEIKRRQVEFKEITESNIEYIKDKIPPPIEIYKQHQRCLNGTGESYAA
jgi:hypothetical protein